LFDRANRGYEILIDRDVHQDQVMAHDVRFRAAVVSCVIGNRNYTYHRRVLFES
jgi:hypothetical protein